MREALDTHGYFLVKYDAIISDSHIEGMHEVLHSLFRGCSFARNFAGKFKKATVSLL